MESLPTTERIAPAAEQQTQPFTSDELGPRRRKRVVSVSVPDELHALCTLTGADPEKIIERMLAREVVAIRKAATDALSAEFGG